MASQLKQKGGAALKSVAALVDRVRPPKPGVTVLIYHRVGGHTPVPVDLPTPLFRDQMAELADRAVSLDDALAILAGDLPAPVEHPVVVTFDDGTVDVVEDALPVLVEFEIPALLYVATDFIDEGRPFPDDGRVASWAQLRDAAATGCLDLGSHTHTHALLDRLPADQVAGELDRSIERIGEETGVDAAHFAYPKALAGSRDARRGGPPAVPFGRVLAGTRSDTIGATDPWRLARSPIQVADGLQWFRAKADGGLGFEDDVRQLVNHARDRGATT